MPDFKALVRARLGPLLDADRAADIVDELAQHCADLYTDLVAGGEPEDEAVAQALAPLADPSAVADAVSRADRRRSRAPEPPPSRTGSFVPDVWRDARYAVRLLRRAPGFAAAAIVMLALGIGANAAIFAVVRSVVLRPLPYSAPDRLTTIGEADPQGHAGNVGFTTIVDWRDRTHAFESIAAFRSWSPTLALGGEPERIPAMRVSANFFKTLGVAPALGRDFTDADDTPAAWRVVLLSDTLWRRRFGADPGVIGRMIVMNDQEYRIVGVLPAAFQPLISEHFYAPAEMWAALGYDRTLSYACRSCEHLKAIARIRPGVTIDAARRDLSDVFTAMKHESTEYGASSAAAVTELADELSGGVRPALLALLGAVAFVLLIACANVANLFLVRMSARQRDLAMRAALGASRSRIVRQLLIESFVVAMAGAAAGLVLAAAAVPLIVSLTPVAIPRLADARIDSIVAAAAVGVACATAVLFGLAPAWRAASLDLQTMLHGDVRQTARDPSSVARRMLIAVDLALAVVLLTGAGLMIRSVGRLLQVDPGFDPRGVLTMQISMSGKRYEKDAAVVAHGEQALARLRTLPGVEAAALTGQVPLGGNIDRWGLHVEGRDATADDPFGERYSVTPDYFSVMRIPLRAGRLLTPFDRAGTEPVIVIGEQTARTLWPRGDALGKRLKIGGTDGPWYRIVGIVGDVRHVALASPPTRQFYTAQAQSTDSFVTVVIRTAGDVAALAPSARQAIWSVMPDVPVYQTAPLSTLVAASVGDRRFVMILLELFGIAALLMTVVGVYGVVSYTVGERTREIGIRSAFGASRKDIAALILRHGTPTIAAGLAAGLLLATATTRLLGNSLYGISPIDPLTFGGVAGLLAAVALAAQIAPVLRATRVDPVIALRQE